MWSRGEVTLSRGADRHAPVEGEVLIRGTRVRTSRDGALGLSLRNGSIVEFGSRTQAVMFAPPLDDPPDRPPSTTTVLRTGSLRFHVAPGVSVRRTIPVATSAAIVYLGRGDGVLTADESGHMTRIAVHRGRASVTTRRGSFVVHAHHGTVQRGVQRPRLEHLLLAQPRWVIAPPERVVSVGGPVAVSALYGLPHGRPSLWRIEVARDAAFHDLASSATRPGSSDLWLLESLAPGRYFVRVRGVDDDGLEGPASPVAAMTVAAPVISRGHEGRDGAYGRASSVVMPRGFYCGVDGMNLARVEAPLRLAPGRAHSLRCAPSADGRHAQEFTLAGADAGPITYGVRLYTGASGDGVLGLSLHGSDGTPVSYADVEVEGDANLSVDAVREGDARGDYAAKVRWAGGATRARLRVTVNRVETYETEVSRDR